MRARAPQVHSKLNVRAPSIEGPEGQRLDVFKIHPIRVRDGEGKVVKTYESAKDLYDYIQCGRRGYSVILLVMIATVAQAFLVKIVQPSLDEPLWWVSLWFSTGIFFVFDFICVGVIMRYDNHRLILKRFNSLTAKTFEKKGDLQVPYLNISERMSGVAMTNDSMPTVFSMEAIQPDVEVRDNFEAWLRLREVLVTEVSSPSALMHSLFLPTCTIVMLGLFVSVSYVVLRIFLMGSNVGAVAFSQIFVLVTTLVFTIAIFFVANNIQDYFFQHEQSISGLEFEISQMIFNVERASGIRSEKLDQLKAFYRLAHVANTFMHSAPARPRVMGLVLSSWLWVWLFVGVITLNALFVIASVEDPSKQAC